MINLNKSLLLFTVSACFGIGSLCSNRALADPSCSDQALPKGVYYIRSVMGDQQPRCLDKATQDSSTIQFYFCNGGDSQKFTFLTLADSLWPTKGCYVIQDNKQGLLGVNGHNDGSSDPQIVHSSFLYNTAAWWQILKTGNGIYTLYCVNNCGGLNNGCMNRKNPDDDGRAQVIEKAEGVCYGVIEERYYIQLSKNRAVNKKTLR
jgi:hypothetical protein